MDNFLLDILVCPKCKSSLRLLDDYSGDFDIEDGGLECTACAATFPIINGIPRFVPVENYASSFGLQWNKFRTEQLDSVNGSTISKDRFYSVTEWNPNG